MFRKLPEAAVVLYLRDVFESVWHVQDPLVEQDLLDSLRNYLKVQYCFSVSSGRAALTCILKALRMLSDKTDVIIPAYTCFSVPSAIVKAGLKVRLCDIKLETLDFDYEYLGGIDFRNVLALVTCNLFGLTCDYKSIQRIAHKERIFVIDDSAQALGNNLDGRMAGTFGDVGFFSLGKGKNITTFQGGIIVTHHSNIARLIRGQLAELPSPSLGERMAIFFKLLFYSIFLNPRLYWMVSKMPGVELGVSRFEPGFAIKKLSAFQAELGKRVLKRLDQYNHLRRRNASRLAEELRTFREITIPVNLLDDSVYPLRLPIIVSDPSLRERLYHALQQSGIAASKMYPTSLDRVHQLLPHLAQFQECPQARFVADRLLTLPTHPYVQDQDIANITRVIRGALKS